VHNKTFPGPFERGVFGAGLSCGAPVRPFQPCEMGWLKKFRSGAFSGDAVLSSALGQPPSRSQQDTPWEGKVASRARELWPLLSLWLFLLVFAVIYSIYVYKSLLSDDPAIGHWLPSASDTNLVVSVLSQVFANSIDLLLLGVFDVLRWQLAARLPGVSAATFFQLSSSTSWIPMFFLTISKISGGWIGLIRYCHFWRSCWSTIKNHSADLNVQGCSSLC
jgi:hypothetical protein